MKILKRGQIWRVDLDPTLGAEIKKTRPCVIVSSDAVHRLPLRIVVPLTDWNDSFAGSHFHVPVEVTDAKAFEAAVGLKKAGAADVAQIRCVSEDRFVGYIAQMSASKMEEIVAAIAAIIEYA